MTEMPFDLTDPPADPPAGARRPQLWLVAICVFRDHVPSPGGFGAVPRCRTCGETWPCRCRRLAERALVDACTSDVAEQQPGAPAAPAVPGDAPAEQS
jgi:hypothetical protein